MSHPRSWKMIAVVSDVAWIRRAILLFGFLLPGRVRVFALAEAAAARAWIAASQPRSRRNGAMTTTRELAT
ncbi:MAG TPA: STAS/SEC14 domain-containing protein [Acetobacteraceae bacterium]|nr:STAS/SEC14 domain-containing protein [Acetobacteraceae bacterium]